MKLNINAKELLALHNLLFERFDGRVAHDRCESDNLDEVQLRQVYNRLRSIIVSGLDGRDSGKVDLRFESWLKHEQAKVDELNKQNEAVKAAVKDPDFFVPVAPDDILTDDEDEVPVDLGYPKPRRGPPAPHMPKPGKHRGRRK